jgi:hypothetical protein
MASLLDAKILSALQIVVERLEGTNIKWTLAGSVSLALQGVKIKPRDIDVLTDREGALGIAELLKEHERKPVKFKSDKMARSFFGEFEVKGVTVEVMGDLEERVGSDWVSMSCRLVSPKWVKIDGMKVPVSPLDEQLRSYMLSSREKDRFHSQKIREALRARMSVCDSRL